MITTVVGNYPRVGPGPGGQRLRQAIARYDQGKITEQDLAQAQDDVTAEVIREQVELGLDLVTDGQVRWDDAPSYFGRRIQGFSVKGLIRYFDTNTYYRQPIATAPLSWSSPIVVKDYQFAARISTRPVKAVLPGPYTFARLARSEHHDGLGSFVMELAEVLNREALALQEAGAEHIQFDEPAILQHPDDFPLLAEAAPMVVRNIRVKTALYTYFRPLGPLWPVVTSLPFHVLGFDFVAGRDNFRAISQFPPEKELALGVVDSRNTRMETDREIAKAIDWASRLLSLERVYVNPNCGLEFLPRETARQKLAHMVQVVRRAEGGKA